MNLTARVRRVRTLVAESDGTLVGEWESNLVGIAIAALDSVMVDSSVGAFEDTPVGTSVGACVGTRVGTLVTINQKQTFTLLFFCCKFAFPNSTLSVKLNSRCTLVGTSDGESVGNWVGALQVKFAMFPSKIHKKSHI